ncbi:MAG: radical SAM protein, partial [Candidatus Bathyarchaeia archaeon]
MDKNGFPIVLTADRTLMSEYGGAIFLGFSACVPIGLIPDKLYFSLFCPSIDVNEDGSVNVAPCGIRKVEATLLDKGFLKEDIVVAHPDHLEKVVGSRTKVLGITENDPLGIGPATSTFTGVFGGEAYMAVKFRELLNNFAVRKFRPKIVVGGPGAWQLEPEEVRSKMGVDCVVIGEGERVVASVFEKALNGDELPGVVYGEPCSVDEIPVIRGATTAGLIEIARGCGRGCDFCVPTLR